MRRPSNSQTRPTAHVIVLLFAPLLALLLGLRRLAHWRIAATLALLLAAGCARPVSEWDRVQGAIAEARLTQDHPREVGMCRTLVTLARDFPPIDSTRLVQGYDLLQQALMGAGNYPEALEYQQHLLGLMDGMQRPDSSLLRRLLVETADAARRVGKPVEVERYLARAVALHRADGYADWQASLHALAALARTNATRGRFAAAESLQRQAVDVSAANTDTTGLDREMLLAALAEVVDQQGRTVEAESLYRQALESGELSFGENHPMIAMLPLALGNYLHAHGRHAEAVPQLEHGIRLSAASPAYDAATQAEHLHRLAGSSARIGDWEKARAAAERAIALHQNANPPAGTLPRTWVSDLAITYVQLGRSTAAESLLARYPGKKPDPER